MPWSGGVCDSYDGVTPVFPSVLPEVNFQRREPADRMRSTESPPERSAGANRASAAPMPAADEGQFSKAGLCQKWPWLEHRASPKRCPPDGLASR